jgi:hypothetical protein
MSKQVKFTDEAYDRVKSYLDPGESFSQLMLRTFLPKESGAPGAPEQIRTNNNVLPMPPRPPAPPTPLPVQPDPLTMTFGSVSDAGKMVKKLNREVGWTQYFINNDPFDNIITIKRHPTLEEKAKAAIEAEELMKLSYQKHLERVGRLSQPDCASH